MKDIKLKLQHSALQQSLVSNSLFSPLLSGSYNGDYLPQQPNHFVTVVLQGLNIYAMTMLYSLLNLNN
jgi:hypothetical protein